MVKSIELPFREGTKPKFFQRTHRSRLTVTSLALVMGSLIGGSLVGDEPEADAQVIELRETISKTVDVKVIASQELTKWKIAQASMNQLLELHREELRLLENELKTGGLSAEGHDQRTEDLNYKISELKKAREEMDSAVTRNKSRVQAIAKSFPEPLRDDLSPELITLKRWQSGDEPRDGLQAILGILSKAEQFNRRITRDKQVRNKREVEVIYLGLGRAFYVDKMSNGGVGEPARDGWVWTANERIADQIQMALDELDKKRPPEAVKLPIKLKEVEVE